MKKPIVIMIALAICMTAYAQPEQTQVSPVDLFSTPDSVYSHGFEELSGAYSIMWEVTGTVWAVNNFDGSLTTVVPIGTEVRVRYTFDPSARDVVPNSLSGRYEQHLTTGHIIQGYIGEDVFFSDDDWDIRTENWDSIPEDDYRVVADDAISIEFPDETFTSVGLFVSMVDYDGAVFNSNALPLLPFDLANFPEGYKGITFEKIGPTGSAQWHINAHVETLTLIRIQWDVPDE